MREFGWKKKHIDDIRYRRPYASEPTIRALVEVLGVHIQTWVVRNRILVVPHAQYNIDFSKEKWFQVSKYLC